MAKTIADYARAVDSSLEEYHDAVLEEKEKTRDTLKKEIEKLSKEKNKLTAEKVDYVHKELKKELKNHFFLHALTGDDKTSEISTQLNTLIQNKLDQVIANLKKKI